MGSEPRGMERMLRRRVLPVEPPSSSSPADVGTVNITPLPLQGNWIARMSSLNSHKSILKNSGKVADYDRTNQQRRKRRELRPGLSCAKESIASL